MRVLVLLLLLLPQLAAARVYMCVDQATGRTSFSDKGCEATASTAEVRVPPANVDSGRRTAESEAPKTWRSDVDTRKTGRDYNAERRSLGDNRATASLGAGGGPGGS